MNKLIFMSNLGKEEVFFIDELNSNIKEKNRLKKMLQDNMGVLYFIHNNKKIKVGIDINLNLFSYEEEYQNFLKNDNRLTVLRQDNRIDFKLNIKKENAYIDRRLYDDLRNNTILGIAVNLNVNAFNRFIMKEQRFPTKEELEREIFLSYYSTYINGIRIKDIRYTSTNSLKKKDYNFIYMEYISKSDKENRDKSLINIKCRRYINREEVIDEFVVDREEMKKIQKQLRHNNPNYRENRLIIAGICTLITNGKYYYKKIEQFNLFNTTDDGLYIDNFTENELYKILKDKELLFTRNIKSLSECRGYSPFGILSSRIDNKIVYLDGVYNKETEESKSEIFNKALRHTHICLDINNVKKVCKIDERE